jgi:hypothetical protein
MTYKVSLIHHYDMFTYENSYVEIDQWARVHCLSYISNPTSTKPKFGIKVCEYRSYLFEDEKDAVWFSLRWK